MENYFNFVPIELSVIISYYLDLQDLNNLCEINYACNYDDFWRELFITKFGKPILDDKFSIPDYITDIISYKKFYIEILSISELINEPREQTASYMQRHIDQQSSLLNKLDKHSIMFIIDRSILTHLDLLYKTKHFFNLDIMSKILEKCNSKICGEQLIQSIINKSFNLLFEDKNKTLHQIMKMVLDKFGDLFTSDYYDFMYTAISHIIRNNFKFNFDHYMLNLLEDYIRKTNPSFDIRSLIKEQVTLRKEIEKI